MKVIEPVGHLREICQTTAHKDRSNVYMRYVCRYVSVYLTKALLTANLRANQVSYLMILTGVFANIFFLVPRPQYFVVGTICLQLWYLLDCCDGEVARYHQYCQQGSIVQDKSECKLIGAFIDYLNHYVVHGLVPLTMSYSLLVLYRWPGIILIGIWAAMGQILLLALFDAKAQAFLSKINRFDRIKIVRKTDVESAQGKARWSVAKWIFVVIHYSCSYPTVMNVATVMAIVNMWTRAHFFDLRILFLFYYCIATSISVGGIFYRLVQGEILEKEFSDQYQPV